MRLNLPYDHPSGRGHFRDGLVFPDYTDECPTARETALGPRPNDRPFALGGQCILPKERIRRTMDEQIRLLATRQRVHRRKQSLATRHVAARVERNLGSTSSGTTLSRDRAMRGPGGRDPQFGWRQSRLATW